MDKVIATGLPKGTKVFRIALNEECTYYAFLDEKLMYFVEDLGEWSPSCLDAEDWELAQDYIDLVKEM